MKAKAPKKPWRDPVKGRDAKEETMQTPGDFSQFVDLMKKVVKVRPPREAEPKSASHASGAS